MPSVAEMREAVCDLLEHRETDANRLRHAIVCNNKARDDFWRRIHAAQLIGCHALLPINLPSVCTSLDVQIVVDADMPQGLHGLLIPGSSVHTCFVNGTLSISRLRFTVAHELKHLIFDAGPVWERSILDSRDPIERDANRFASELLMPYDEMMRLYNQRVSFECMRSIFAVSKRALDWRLAELGLPTRWGGKGNPPLVPPGVTERRVAFPRI